MKKIILVFLIIGIILITGCAQKPETAHKGPGPTEGSMQGTPPEGTPCYTSPGEWHPEQGECPGITPEMKLKCEEFCAKNPDCCQGKGQEGSGFGGRSNLALPKAEEVSKLTRNYPSIIKAVNEGPALYQQDKFEVISDATLDKIKDTGFNTIQMLTINDCTGEKCVMDEASKLVLLNDIVKAKQKGLAVWVAVEFINAPPGSDTKLPEYEKFKSSFIQYCREIGELMEQYKVEYVSANNEPDLFLQEQTQWGSEEQISKYVAEIMPLSNSAVKEKFTGKIINKITKPKTRTAEVLAASFKNVDIAGVDVGPPIEGGVSYEAYKGDFEDYQYYASLAQKANIPWMNAEYWQYNYFETPTEFVKQNQVKYAQVSFDAYLKTTPKGVGYTWNDFSTFEIEPNGEAARLAIKEFFNKI